MWQQNIAAVVAQVKENVEIMLKCLWMTAAVVAEFVVVFISFLFLFSFFFFLLMLLWWQL